MADIISEQTFVEQLKEFELPNVEFTGEKLRGGSGSYGYVEVVLIAGTRCAAKFSHQVFEEYQWKTSPADYFRKECTLMSQLRHPHIVQFLGVCCHHQEAMLPAIVMELLMTCLHNYLEVAKTASLPIAIKHNILLGVSKGLVYLHSMDIVHRDLTARNILLSDSLTPKIADLGMARLQAGREAATMTNTPGNANYMPPEAKDNDITRYGKPIDCFSIGHLILFTIIQVFPIVLGSTYFNETTGLLMARTEIERREQGFKITREIVGLDHPLVLLACDCLAVRPSLRPTAPQIMQKLQTMSIIPYRSWELTKHEMMQVVIKHEDTIHKLQDKLASKQTVTEQNTAAQEEPVLSELYQQAQADDQLSEGLYVNVPQSPTTLQWSSDESEYDYVNDMQPSPGCKQNTPKQHAKSFPRLLLHDDDRTLKRPYINVPQSPTILQSSDESEDDYVNDMHLKKPSPGCKQNTPKQHAKSFPRLLLHDDDRTLKRPYVNVPQSPTTLQSSDESEYDYVNDMHLKKPSPGCKQLQNTPKQHAKSFPRLLLHDDGQLLEGSYVNVPQSPTILQWSSDESEDDYVNQPMYMHQSSPDCEQDTRKQHANTLPQYVNVQSPKLDVDYDEVPPKFQFFSESPKAKKPLALPRRTRENPVAIALNNSTTKSPLVSRLYRKQVPPSHNNQSMAKRKIECKRQSSLSSLVTFPNSPVLSPHKTTFQYGYRSRVSAMTGLESPKLTRTKSLQNIEAPQNKNPEPWAEVVATPVTNKESRSFKGERFRKRSLSADAVLGSWTCRHCGKKLKFVSGTVCYVCCTAHTLNFS
ncbi:serine/threonine-protein kinase MAK-like [Halichondria panicea]|uniref:serine/threonine-protein kinase MAK-like n=1 Tax=Halichondria panicea TaxID=6063 RepID=UPI00312B86B0